METENINLLLDIVSGDSTLDTIVKNGIIATQNPLVIDHLCAHPSADLETEYCEGLCVDKGIYEFVSNVLKKDKEIKIYNACEFYRKSDNIMLNFYPLSSFDCFMEYVLENPVLHVKIKENTGEGRWQFIPYLDDDSCNFSMILIFPRSDLPLVKKIFV
uniref:Uncharacterized protein n=1 Tax=viral metagenome TaxID=1070528 RepID=A0A6C0EB04_9ZZZZ